MKFFDNKKESNSHQPEKNPPAPVPPAPAAPAPAPQKPVEAKVPSPPAPVPQRRGSNTVIGTTITIRGDITAEETVTIEGSVDGTIETTHDVVIAPDGKVRADIRASVVTISGRVKGDIYATNKVDLTSSGQLEGNIQAPKLAIAESAVFRGSIDMSPPAASNQPGKGERRLQPEGELVKN